MARMTRARREALARFGAMFLTYSEDPSPPSSPLSSEGKVNSIEAIDGSASSVEIASVTTNVVLVADENPPNVVTMANGGSAVCEDPPSELLGVRVDPAAGENPRASIQDNECESPLPVQSCANRRTRRLRIVESDSEEETKSAESQCHECVPSQVSGKRRRAPIFDESSDDSEDNWLPMEHVGGSHKRSQRSRHQAAVETSDDSDPEFVASLLAPEDVGQSASADIDTEGLYIFLRANDYRLKIVNGVEVEQFHVVWLEPNDKATGKARTSTTWEPEESFAMTEDGKDAIEILRKFNRARLTKPSLTFDQFIKTPEMRRGMTADDDGLCVFNSLKLVLELASVNVGPFDKAFESFKSKKKEKNVNLSDGVNHKALCEFAKIITKLGVNLSLQDFKNRVTSAICGPDRLLEVPLSDGIYLVGAYDQSSPPVGHCFALSVEAGTFYMVEKRQGIARFKLGRFGEVNVYGEWIHEIRFVLPVVVRLNKGKKSFK
ncbi:hypothetical protein FI667_g10110, partial [Globisporangium splendens]